MADDLIEIRGLNSLLRLLARLPKLVDEAARQGAEDAARDESARIRTRARSTSRQARLAARSVRAEGGSIVGASGGGVPAAIFYGAEFGGGSRPRTRQFPAFRGTQGYFMFPTLRDDEERIVDHFDEALDQVVVAEWERG